MLLYATIGSILPAVVKLLQYLGQSDNNSWEWFLASKQEIMVFGMLITIVLISSFLFSMEYRYNTASYIFTSKASRYSIFIAKIMCLFCIVTFLEVVSALSYLLFGLIAIKGVIPAALFSKFIEVTVWYIFSFFLVSVIVAMLSVLTKKFVISTVIAFAYLMLVFPVHLKGNPYVLPFMTPSVIASKIYNTDNYIFVGYFKAISVNSLAVILFLALTAAISIIVSLIGLKRSDAVR
jgi:ABC-2 type transport system permease protein